MHYNLVRIHSILRVIPSMAEDFGAGRLERDGPSVSTT